MEGRSAALTVHFPPQIVNSMSDESAQSWTKSVETLTDLKDKRCIKFVNRDINGKILTGWGRNRGALYMIMVMMGNFSR